MDTSETVVASVPTREQQLAQAVIDLQMRATLLEQALQQQHAMAAQTQALATKLHNPDTYGGECDPALVEQWGHQVKQYILLQGVDDGYQVALAATFLKAGALLWRVERQTLVTQGVLPACTNIDEFLAVIKAHFVLLEGRHIARDKLAKLTQRSSVAAYSDAFLWLTLSIPGITEKEKIDRYIRGLKLEPRCEVLVEQVQTLQEAMVITDKVDSIVWGARRVVPVSNEGSAGDTATPMELGVVQPEFQGNCFTCGQWGHKASNCPSNPACVRGTNTSRGRGSNF